jgi:predicted dehydrogenase
MTKRNSRRWFLQTASLGGVGFWVAGGVGLAQSRSPNEKLNMAAVGVAGIGTGNIGIMQGENVVGLCDVDERRTAPARNRFPQAKFYTDFRRMYDELDKQLDAVIISTPDHIHAPAAIAAMLLGKHVLVEKPLAHNVSECYRLAEVARKMKVVTQMDNEGHAVWHNHRAAELVKAGVIGKVTEVHCNLLKPSDVLFPPPYTKPNMLAESGRPQETPPVPPGLHWDLWLGPAPERPYHPAYCPHNWRNWWDFGTGPVGDFVCHYMDVAFMALDLKFPVSAEAAGGRPVPYERTPNPSVRYVFPARGDQPPVTVYWHAAGSGPPADLLEGERSTCLMVGDKGAMACMHGSGSKEPVLLPKKKFADFHRPEVKIPPLRSHKNDWLHAIKTGGKAACDFAEYAAYLGVAAVLWQVSFKLGRKIEWDGQKMCVPNCPEAEPLIRRTYRKGWEL